MRTKPLFFAIAAVLGAGAVFAATHQKAESPKPVISPAHKDQREKTPAAETAQPETVPHPVSIAALAQKQYDGRDLTVGSILENNTLYTRYYITYKSGELAISGIMNVPKGAMPEGGFPVLVLNHGYIDPSVYTNGRGLRREQDYLARQGFAVIHPDYRNHAQSSKDENAEVNLRLGYAEDVINAVHAVKNSDLTYLHKTNIGMLGHSMGGGVTINLLVAQPSLIKAAVLYAPVSANAVQNFERWTKTRPEVAKKIVELYGSPEDKPEFWKNVSAENFLDRIQAPALIFHGTEDDSVPYNWSVTLEQNLKAASKNASLITYEGEVHEFGPRWDDFMGRSADFFRQHLR